MSGIKIALDGPSGAGKSTIAKELAARLGFTYIDTGAMYRAVGLFAMRNGVDTLSEKGVADILTQAEIDLRYESGVQHIFLNGEDVSEEIRKPEMSIAASNVGKHGAVRSMLVNMQRALAEKYDVIMDGRDIGTVVFPDADVKIFVTAAVEVRAMRRYKELLEKGENQSYEEVLADMKLRDHNDSTRKISPLKRAEDAVLADTSDMTFDESVEFIYNTIKERI